MFASVSLSGGVAGTLIRGMTRVSTFCSDPGPESPDVLAAACSQRSRLVTLDLIPGKERVTVDAENGADWVDFTASVADVLCHCHRPFLGCWGEPLEAHYVPRQPAMLVAHRHALRLSRRDHRLGWMHECAEVAAPQSMQQILAADDHPAERVPGRVGKRQQPLRMTGGRGEQRS